MTERDALLAAIRANPDEDTPRLAFADWLDENEPDARPRGKKSRALAPSSWAGLIRAECELARLDDDGSASAAMYRFFSQKDEQSIAGVRWDRVDPDVARRIQLRTLADRLYNPSSRARRIGQPMKAVAGLWWGDGTRRGFPDELQVGDGERLLARLPALLGYCPATRVEVNGPLATVEVLVAAGLPRLCRDLRVSLGTAGHAPLVVAMSASSETAGVHALHCIANDDQEAARALGAVADSPHWSGLRELSLDASLGISSSLTNEVILRTLHAPHLRGLRRLKIVGAGTVADVIAALAGLSELRDLALSNCGLDDGDAERLADTPALANVRYLDLQNNQIGGRGASALLASPHLANVAVLDLDHNAVRGLDRAALARAPAGGLRTVGLHGSRLTANDITALTASPRLSDLMYFDADYNELPESAVARLVKGFGERPPAVLYLAGNGIAAAGVEALTNWPAAARIDMLHLIGNTLPTAATKAIAACPHLKGLNHLCAAVSHPAGRKVLQKCFGKRAFV